MRVDLTTVFTDGDNLTLPAMWRNHAHQANRTGSERVVKGTARF
jgi:hypothetical protein